MHRSGVHVAPIACTPISAARNFTLIARISAATVEVRFLR
jgi:hypothetical protein